MSWLELILILHVFSYEHITPQSVFMLIYLFIKKKYIKF